MILVKTSGRLIPWQLVTAIVALIAFRWIDSRVGGSPARWFLIAGFMAIQGFLLVSIIRHYMSRSVRSSGSELRPIEASSVASSVPRSDGRGAPPRDGRGAPPREGRLQKFLYPESPEETYRRRQKWLMYANGLVMTPLALILFGIGYSRDRPDVFQAGLLMLAVALILWVVLLMAIPIGSGASTGEKKGTSDHDSTEP